MIVKSFIKLGPGHHDSQQCKTQNIYTHYNNTTKCSAYSRIMPSMIILGMSVLNIIILNVIMLDINMMSIIMHSIILLSVIILSVIIMSVIMGRVVMLNVVMLSVVAPILSVQCFQVLGLTSMIETLFNWKKVIRKIIRFHGQWR